MKMNKKAQIGRAANFIAIVFVAIAILAILAPHTSVLFAESSANANLTGIAKVVVEHYNVLLLLVLTLITFITLWVLTR